MLGLCERYAKSTQEAEDCMMEGFIHVFQHLDQFEHKSSLETWMRRIMVRVVLDHLRIRQRRIVTEPMMDEEPLVAGPDNDIVTQLSARIIIERMAEMPEEQRVIFNLHTIDDLTFKDIADILKMNANTVRAYYQRARVWLQREIGNSEI